MTLAVVLPPHKHLNGQIPLTASISQGKRSHWGMSASGIGDVAQLYNSHLAPPNPLEHGQEQMLVLNMNPFSHRIGLQDVTGAGVVVGCLMVVVGAIVVPPHRHLNGQTPLTPDMSHGKRLHWGISASGIGDMAQLKLSQRGP